ncbi:iron-containing alcohol dehydrogenase [Roseovarius arcticus]|uniref:iron-containing alcohol dehydrogenase n=1 Tax=Roseovarius arcticus TaxID=2547404 RepID=UPI001BB208D9|nr:iron-containing alcohol dehydrogenase [Roseovarius arcticus]
MWTYNNPVNIKFGSGAFDQLHSLIAGRRYALVTYSEPPFVALTVRLTAAVGAPVLTINDIAPNPDYSLLTDQCARFATLSKAPKVIVALGGGSVIDSAKVVAIAEGDFARVRAYLETKKGGDALTFIPIIAIPTTAGTGSEVTSWATVWDEANKHKHSLAHPNRRRAVRGQPMTKIEQRHEGMRIVGEIVFIDDVIEVLYPYTDKVVGTVPAGKAEHARRAFEIAEADARDALIRPDPL